MKAAAEVWLEVAERKLQSEIAAHQDSATISDRGKERIALLQKDKDAKRGTLAEAQAYSNDPQLFAQRCIELVGECSIRDTLLTLFNILIALYSIISSHSLLASPRGREE